MALLKDALALLSLTGFSIMALTWADIAARLV
jgi:hypothetical protein